MNLRSVLLDTVAYFGAVAFGSAAIGTASHPFASASPTLPPVTPATVPGSPATGNAPAGVSEPGTDTRPVWETGVIGDPSWSSVEYATVTEPAVRQPQVAVGPPPLPPRPVDGDCASWQPLLERYGIPYAEALPYMQRESGCSMAVNLNDRTRDASYGPLQVNRYGNLADWWDGAGYTVDVMNTPEGAVAAAAVLYHSCGWSPWQPPYGCDGDYLQTPEPGWPWP